MGGSMCVCLVKRNFSLLTSMRVANKNFKYWVATLLSWIYKQLSKLTVSYKKFNVHVERVCVCVCIIKLFPRNNSNLV